MNLENLFADHGFIILLRKFTYYIVIIVYIVKVFLENRSLESSNSLLFELVSGTWCGAYQCSPPKEVIL